MQIDIFDVEHGQCSVITCLNGQKILVDTGHNAATGWRPSVAFRGQYFARVLITNVDEDHMSDFAGIQEQCSFQGIWHNNNLTPDIIRKLKQEYGMGRGVEAFAEFLDGSVSLGDTELVGLGGVEVVQYYNSYPAFTDENNLSAVYFVHYGNFSIAFTGDIEKAGWDALLEQPGFKEQLQRVSIFMASHHGRENGCNAKVFEHCFPSIIVISDGGKQHTTQETTDWYASKAQGIQCKDGQTRSVYTTRKHKNMRIEVPLSGGFTIFRNVTLPSNSYA